MKIILVPLDGSSMAEQVLPDVRQLASVLDARVRLLRVVEESADVHVTGRTPLLDADQAQTTQRILSEQAAAYLAAQLSAFAGTSIAVDYDVRTGNPGETIVSVAASESVTLIAMASHGYSGLHRWALGSVSDKVAQTATVPVLFVRGVEYQPLNEHRLTRILVPLDGSECARQALPHALDLVRRADAQLVLVTAINPNAPSFAWSEQSHTEMAHRLQATATDALDSLAAILRHENISVRTIVQVGPPAEVILNVAAEQQVDLIAMATHGVSGPRRWAIGSVADKVLHAATTPLLLVRSAQGKSPEVVQPRSTISYTAPTGEQL